MTEKLLLLLGFFFIYIYLFKIILMSMLVERSENHDHNPVTWGTGTYTPVGSLNPIWTTSVPLIVLLCSFDMVKSRPTWSRLGFGCVCWMCHRSIGSSVRVFVSASYTHTHACTHTHSSVSAQLFPVFALRQLSQYR